MPEPPSPSDRRRFFREALGRSLRPILDFLDGEQPAPKRASVLRPPGAIPEADFSDTCRRCGACIEICPANAIFALSEGAESIKGTPVIDPDRGACVVCDGLQCTHVCPSGALLPLEAPQQIRMGLAQVYSSLCVRSNGEECTACVDLCPLGKDAITFEDSGPPHVYAEGCTGCGVCQQHCPTSPKAIVVKSFHGEW